jgi:hypothetical protein
MEEGVIDSLLPAAIAPTAYGRWGDWLLLLLLVATSGSAIILKLTGGR